MKRTRQRGAALAIALVAITALLGLGALTVLGVQTDLAAAGQSRFGQLALYAAESGVSAGMDFLRTHCSTTTLFSAWVSPANGAPPAPAEIVGNGVLPDQPGYPFAPGSELWYEVSIRNNPSDPGFAAGEDTDGQIILHAVGHGPDQTLAAVELEVQDTSCLVAFCAHEYAQRNVTSRNDGGSACSARVTAGLLRALEP